jgi:imidazolonepropionase-like amidohydrolase
MFMDSTVGCTSPAQSAATVGPAKFIGKQDEFGTITAGKRADLLLVERNPLQDMSCLKRPLGVMVRGIWLPKEELQEMLLPLAR